MIERKTPRQFVGGLGVLPECMGSSDSRIPGAGGAEQTLPRIDALLDHIQDAIAAFDAGWRITYVNRAATRLCGRSAADLVGENALHIFPQADGTVISRELHRAAAEREHRHFAEHYPDLDMWIEGDAYPVDGGVVVVVRDVTIAEKRELTERRADERLRLALSFGNMAVWEWDLRPRAARRPPELETMFGVPTALFVGSYESILPFACPEDVAAIREASEVALRGIGALNGVVNHEYRALSPDGCIRYLYSRGRVLNDERGEAGTLLGVTMDVTEQRRAADELQNKLHQLQALLSLAEVANFAQDPGEVCQAALSALLLASAADRAAVLLVDPDGTIRFKAWTDLSDGYRAAVEGHSPWEPGTADAQPILVSDVIQEEGLRNFQELHAREGLRALAFIPLLGKGGVIGRFMLYYNEPHEFRQEEIRIAQAIATHVALAAERRMAESELRQSEARFRAAFLQSAAGMTEASLSGQFRLVNQRSCEMLGYTEAELLGMSFLDVTHPDDRAACASVAAKLLSGEASSHSMEKRYLRKDGTTIWALTYVSMVRDQNGRPQYFLGVVEDITSRTQAEQALKESQRQLALAQGAARLGIWEADLRLNTITFSKEFAQLYGLAPDHGPLSREEWLGMIHPADREHVQLLMKQSLEETHLWDAEFRVVRPDGTVLWVLGKGSVFLDDTGRAARVAGVNLDITQRKQAEAALLESEERFRHMADSAPVMMWVEDVDMRATFFNKTWLDFTGRSLAEELGVGWIAGIHPDDLDHCNAEHTAKFSARQSFQIEYRLRRADGNYRWMVCSGVPHFDPDGHFDGYFGSDMDITDLRQAQDAALQSQKLESLGVLTRGIAHDFNNLLGSILMDAELAEVDLAEGVSPMEQIGRVKSVAIRAAEIVRELMIYSGQDTADLGPVDLSRLVEEMLELLKISISKNAALKMQLCKDLPAVRGNAPQLRQVVMNLIINASEAIGARDGAIRVATSLASGGDTIRLEVSDSGAGMTEEQKAKVFDPFFTTKFAGRGLGLAVVLGIVRNHGGTIGVTTAPGRGTTFEILLPRAAEVPQLAQLPDLTVAAEPAAAAHATLLLVEDEEMLRNSVSRILSTKGFVVLQAGDGSSAIDLLHTQAGKIDLILLDMTIPGAPSREVIANARRICPHTKLILMSAYSREMAMKALESPAVDGFVRKPFQTAHLVQLLRDALHPR